MIRLATGGTFAGRIAGLEPRAARAGSPQRSARARRERALPSRHIGAGVGGVSGAAEPSGSGAAGGAPAAAARPPPPRRDTSISPPASPAASRKLESVHQDRPAPTRSVAPSMPATAAGRRPRTSLPDCFAPTASPGSTSFLAARLCPTASSAGLADEALGDASGWVWGVARPARSARADPLRLARSSEEPAGADAARVSLSERTTSAWLGTCAFCPAAAAAGVVAGAVACSTGGGGGVTAASSLSAGGSASSAPSALGGASSSAPAEPESPGGVAVAGSSLIAAGPASTCPGASPGSLSAALGADTAGACSAPPRAGSSPSGST
jgi:hypothetical protein